MTLAKIAAHLAKTASDIHSIAIGYGGNEEERRRNEGGLRRRRGSEDGDKEEALRSSIALSVGPGEEGYRSGRPVFAGERGEVAFLLKTGEKRQERT